MTDVPAGKFSPNLQASDAQNFIWPDWLEAAAPFKAAGQVQQAADDLASCWAQHAWPGCAVRLLPDPALPAEAWRRNVAADGITLYAADAFAARHAIYALLHDAGVRWFAPGLVASVPKQPRPLASRTAYPDLTCRGLHICSAPGHYDPQVVLWMTRLGMNRKLVHHHELEACEQRLIDHGLLADSTVHSYEWWIPDRLWHDKHPQWFPLVGGKRITQAQGGQLCLSNPDMRRQFVANMRQMLDQSPAMRVVGVCPNDGYGWCECDDCREMDQQAASDNPQSVDGRVARFVEYLCDEIQASHPRVSVGHYCYSNFRDFPLHLTKPLPNLTISCTLSRCFRHALDDETCPRNAPLARHLQAIAPNVGEIYTYEYYMHRWGDLPAAMWRTVAADMRAIKRWGVKGFLTEVLPARDKAWDSFALPIAFAAAAMWDTQLDMDAFLDDWCAYRYGRAAQPMRQYLDALDQGRHAHPDCSMHHPADLARMLPPHVIELADHALAAATRAAGDDTDASAAIEHERRRFDYWRYLLDERKRISTTAADAQTLPLQAMSVHTPPAKPGITLIDSQTLIPPAHATGQVWTFADDESVGLLVECVEPRMKDLVIRKGEDLHGVYGSDNVEFFLALSRDAEHCGHILVNPAGASIGSSCIGTRWNWAWQGQWRVQTLQLADRWRVALTLPRASLHMEDEAPPRDANFADRTTSETKITAATQPEQSVCFNITRNRHAGGQWEISGTPTGAASFNPATYLPFPFHSSSHRH